MTDRVNTVLLYSDDPQVRDRMRLAVGPRPAADIAVDFVEAGTHEECIRLMDGYEIDLLLLDGEAAPAGGLGIARQVRDEYDDVPPLVVTVARAADNWLAAYAKVDATIRLPLDPIITGQTVATLLRDRANGGAALPA
jgi:DNA-binding response OmpR family regulator